MKQRIVLSSLILIYILSNCGSDKQTLNNFLPNATGTDSEMLIVMDSSKFKKKLGRSVINVFGENIYGLPQPEPYFDLKYIRPKNFNNILKFAKNIIIIFTLEGDSPSSKLLRNEFNQNSIEKIKSDTTLFMMIKKDQYAIGQEILYLFGKNDQVLLDHIKKNKEKLRTYFERRVIKKVNKKNISNTNKNISKDLMKRFGYNITVPAGFSIAKLDSQFVWLREIDPEIEKNIFIYFENYVSDEIFYKKNIEDFRRKISLKYLRDVENPSVYMTYQKELPFMKTEVNFKEKFSIETRGLWKLSDISGGGPFLSYTFVDKNSDKLYYLEGYVYAPGSKKRDLMREIYSILWSFKI